MNLDITLKNCENLRIMKLLTKFITPYNVKDENISWNQFLIVIPIDH